MIWLTNFLSYAPNVVQGLLYSVMANRARTVEEQIRRGNSPNQMNMLLLRVAAATMPMLPGQLFAPTAEASGHTASEKQYQSNVYHSFVWLTALNVCLVFGLAALQKVLNKRADGNFFKQHCLPYIKKANDNLPQFFFYTNIFIACTAIYLGAWLLPASFLFFNVVHALQSRKYYSDSVRDKIDNLLFWSAAVLGVFYGSGLEQVFFAMDLIGRTGRVLENASYYLIKLLKVPVGWISNKLKRELDILGDRLAPEMPAAFQFYANAQNFHVRLNGIATSPQLRVSKAYVQQARHTLPLAPEGINSLDLLMIFSSDALKNEWPKHHAKIVESMQNDWQASAEEIDFNDIKICLGTLHEGLNTYVTEVREGILPGTVPGSAPRLNRYLDSVTDMVHTAMNVGNDDLVIRVLIKLGVEGGKNCSVGKARAVEEAHRMLINENIDSTVPSEVRVANVFQQNRELFFQQHINQAWFIGFVPWFVHNWLYHGEDTHGYNVAIASCAPRLGLPSFSAQIDLDSQSGRDGFINSLISTCEQRFWRHMTVPSVQGEMQAAVMGTHQFTAQDVQKWYKDFLARYQIGTQDEKEDLLTELGDKAPLDFVDGRNVMHRDFLTLMLLDMGVLYLEGENSWGDHAGAADQPHRQQDASSFYNTLTYGFNSIRNLPAKVVDLAADGLATVIVKTERYTLS